MARHGDYLFRRNGWFYARLRVPHSLRKTYGESDLRVSLGTNEYSAARMRVLEVVLRWKREFARAHAMLDAERLVAGSPLLKGDGLIALERAAREAGLSIENMLAEVRNRPIELRIDAGGWEGTDLPSEDLEFEGDGSLILDSARGLPKGVVVGPLFLRRASLSLVKDGRFEDCLFYRDSRRSRAVVFQLPGVSVPIGALLIAKPDAERLRVDLAAGVTQDMLNASKVARVTAAATSAGSPKHKYAAVRSSELLAKFFAAKPDWSPATVLEMRRKCGAFVELMADPVLGDIDGAMVLEYRNRLGTLPENIGLVRRREGGEKSLLELATITEAAGAARMKETTKVSYLGKLSEWFGWAEEKGFMPRNPARGEAKKPRKVRREQDERQAMSQDSLDKIFSAPWFKAGRGERTAEGKHWSFQPHYFWLPLLAIYVGGRLNELSQLYLDDVKRSASGIWFIDFNVNTPDKLSIDEGDIVGGKRLKTVNSEREVPVHSELIRLNFIGYVEALLAAGHRRLFPELRFDKTKGYAKQSGQWFNERFMGNLLGIERDGSQTFHSFRHSFVSGLMQLDEPPLSENLVAQLAGHERGETMSGKRYAKDREADRLAPYIERLRYELPPISAFDVRDGLEALKHALARKKRQT